MMLSAARWFPATKAPQAHENGEVGVAATEIAAAPSGQPRRLKAALQTAENVARMSNGAAPPAGRMGEGAEATTAGANIAELRDMEGRRSGDALQCAPVFALRERVLVTV